MEPILPHVEGEQTEQETPRERVRYQKRIGYFRKYYPNNKERIQRRQKAGERLKPLLAKGLARWVCLGCDSPVLFDNTRAADRHADLLGHAVVLKFTGDRAACLHHCGSCGIASSCRKDEKYHKETFEIEGPCSLCDSPKEDGPK